MDLSRGQNQEIMANPSLETMSVNSKGHQKPKLPQPAEQALKCPRCDSTNTKFCYYNNYSLSQPRYFCKSCKRYWTKGGTMRNVPVGGGCRKNKRSSSKRTPDQALTSNTNPLMINTHHNIPPLIYDHNPIETNDLTSAFSMLQKQYDYHHDGDDHLSILGNPSLTPAFFGNQNNFQSFCNYGFGNESFGEGDNGGGSAGFNLETMTHYNNEEFIDSTTTTTPTATSNFPVTTMKHDLDHVRDSTLLWGLPWQLIADHGNNNNNNMMMGDWHGVLNTTLM